MKSNGQKPPFPVYDDAGDPRLMTEEQKTAYLNTLKDAALPKDQRFEWVLPGKRPIAPVRGKLIGKIPMQQVCIAEDGGIWHYWFADGKIYWMNRGYTTFK